LELEKINLFGFVSNRDMGLVNLAVGLRKISKKRGIGGNKFTRDGNVFYNLGTKTTNPWPEPSQNAEKTASAGNLVFLVLYWFLFCWYGRRRKEDE
jgi:hypothetical protein